MNASLWTSSEIAAATGGTASTAFAVSGLSIDSRTVQPGDLFIALVGDNHDGHDHVMAALAKGATGALICADVPSLPATAPVVRVPNTLIALYQLATAARLRAHGMLMAVTGSVGKTTTKEMLHHIASHQFGTTGGAHATIGNLNNHIGLPLTLARLPLQAKVGVFEIGMNHANEIAPLATLLRPHIAVITNIGTAHMQNFADGQSGIARAKAEIFTGMASNGVGIIPRDSEYYSLLVSEAQSRNVPTLLSFGVHAEADGRLVSCVPHSESIEVTANIRGRTINYILPVPGEHMALNSVAVLLAVQAAGLDLDGAMGALASFAPLKGRGSRKHFGSITVIDECYNASPLSMQAAIKVLGQSEGAGRRLVALGDMLELGEIAPTAHAELAAVLQAAKVDQVFCCGPLMQHLWQALPAELQGAWTPDAATLAPLVAQAVRADDVVLVKGSRGKQVEINNIMSPSMAQVIAAIERQQGGKDNSSHAA